MIDWSVGRLALLVPLSAAAMGFGAALAMAIIFSSGMEKGDAADNPLAFFFFGGLMIAIIGSIFTVPIAFLTQPPFLILLQRFNRLSRINHLILNAVMGPLLAMVFFSLDDKSMGFAEWLSKGTNAIGSVAVGFFCAVPCGLVWYATLVKSRADMSND